MKKVSPSASVNVNITNIYHPNFQGAGNPINIGGGGQHSRYQGTTLTTGGQHPGENGSGRPTGPGRFHGNKQAWNDDRKSKDSWAAASSSSELPWKPGLLNYAGVDDPDCIVEEDYEEYVEGIQALLNVSS